MKEPVGTLNSLRRLADLRIHVIFEDDETALHLFHAALDGGTKIGIPHFKAKCITAIDDIMVRRGDLAQAKKMWAGALFVRSSRMKDAAAVEKAAAGTGERLDRIIVYNSHHNYGVGRKISLHGLL